MRTVTIDFSADETRRIVSFGGYDGEHNETNLCAILPPRLLSEEVTQYRFVFTNSNGEEITKEPLKAIDGAVSYLLPQQVMVYPELKFYVAALTYDGMENLVVLGKTATATLTIEYPSDGVETEENPYPDNIPIGYTVRNSADGIRSAEDASDNELATEKAISEALDEERNGRYSKEESDNRFANALKGKASGNPIVITDVSPLKHEILLTTDVAEVGIKKYGKNLLPKYKSNIVTKNGVTIERKEDGSIVLNGTAEKVFGHNIAYQVCKDIPVGTTIILSSEGTGAQSWSTYVLNGTMNKSDGTNVALGCTSISESRKPIPEGYTGITINISIYPGAGEMKNVTFRPMIEVGSTATSYEPYKEPELYATDENKELKLVGNGESMTLIADNGATITAEYNRDINKASFGEGGSGTDGKDGKDGKDGATFTPSVSAGGILSWTNDKGLENPPPVNIKGDKGEQGIQGIQGERGLQGEKGDQGIQGIQGVQGVQGIQGEKGDKGDKGDTGATGATGANGKDGAKGEKGDKGDKGDKGKDGKTPVKGTDYFTEADKAEMVADVVDAMEGIPSYWQTALDEGVEAINTALCTAGSSKAAFLFYSDAHWTHNSKKSPALLKYLCNHTGMTKTIYGGDIVNTEGTDYDTMEYLWEWRNAVKALPNHHSVVGNHDDGNSTNNLFSEQYVYGYLLAGEETSDIVRDNDGMYYYIDNPSEQTRYLYLDTAYKGGSYQKEFVKQALLSTTEGWHIVAVAHIWYDTDYTTTPPTVAGLNSNASNLLAMFDNYNLRNGDYAECGGRVEFCIGGHTHRDYNGESTSGIPIILVETDSMNVRSGLSYATGTTGESSVNGIIADYTNRNVYVVRVGRGESREVALQSIGGGYKNILPYATENDGVTIYNKDATPGYKKDVRWSGSSNVETGATGAYLTGYIAVQQGDILYLENITMQNVDGNLCKFIVFASLDDTSEEIIGNTYFESHHGGVWGEDGNLKQIAIKNADAKYVRFQCGGIDETSIITKNEPIE